MREIQIGKNESGQRFDKFLRKYLRDMSTGFMYKMLRKKNIKLNGKKAEGRELLKEGDRVTFFFAEETLKKFRGETEAVYPVCDLSIVYEDDDVLLVNKPVGMLSQKARQDDTTLVEYVLGYLQSEGKWKTGEAFTPGICNRLDRNTSGLVLAGKSLPGLQSLSRILKERTLDKYYLTIVEGVMTEPAQIHGYLSKSSDTNQVTVFSEAGEDRVPIETAYEPLQNNGRETLLRVKLITGKTHQIRAHLAKIGHPLLGDVKYGGKKAEGRRSFFLHAAELHFPDQEDVLPALRGRTFRAPLPPEFEHVKEKLFRK